MLATLLAAVLVWQGGVLPLLDWYGERADAIERQEARATRMAALAASLPALRREAQAVPEATGLLTGATDAVAAAALQERVQELASRAGARLSSVEVLPGQAKGAYRELGIRVALQAPWPVLIDLLAAIAAATPTMLVDDVQIRAAPALPGAGRADPPLDARIGVLAFRAATAPP